MDLVQQVTVVNQWPFERLSILANTTTVSAATAISNFYEMFDRNHYGSNKHGNFLIYNNTNQTAWTPMASSTFIPVSNFAFSWGYTMQWGVCANIDYLQLEVDSPQNFGVVIVYPTRTCPVLSSISTNSKTLPISTINVSPVFANVLPDDAALFSQYWSLLALTATHTPLPSAVGGNNIYVRYVEPYSTLSVTETLFTAATSTASPGTLTTTHTPISGSVFIDTAARADHIDEVFSLRDIDLDGVLEGQDESGNNSSRVSGTINYTTGDINLAWNNGFSLDAGRTVVVTYRYQVQSPLAGTCDLINHKTGGNDAFDTFYLAPHSDFVSISSTYPCYLFSYRVDLGVGSSSESSYPNTVGYTIWFSPSAAVVSQSTKVTISAGFTDNYHQQFVHADRGDSITVVKYSSAVNTSLVTAYLPDGTLYDFATSPWVSGSQYLTLSAASGSYIPGTVSISYSSIDGNLIKDGVIARWVVNPLDYLISPSITASTNSSLTATVVSQKQFTGDELIKWTANPIRNLAIRSAINNLPIVWGQSVYWVSGSHVIVDNLGVEPTNLYVTSTATGNSGLDTWTPLHYNNVTLVHQVDPSKFDNIPFTRTLPISASLVKNGLNYDIPTPAKIRWSSVRSSTAVNVYGTTNQYNEFDFGQYNSGTLVSQITANIEPPIVTESPKWYTVSVGADLVYSNVLSITAAPPLTISVDDFPDPSITQFTIGILASAAPIGVNQLSTFNTKTLSGCDMLIPATSAYNLLFALTGDVITNVGMLSGRHLENMFWTYNTTGLLESPQKASALQGIENAIVLAPCWPFLVPNWTVNITLNGDVTIPGWSTPHRVSDTLKFKFFHGIPTITAIAYPEIIWNGDGTSTNITTGSWDTIGGVSAYGECHTTILTVSVCNPPLSCSVPEFFTFEGAHGLGFTQAQANAILAPFATGQTFSAFMFNVGDHWHYQTSPIWSVAIPSQSATSETLQIGVTGYNYTFTPQDQCYVTLGSDLIQQTNITTAPKSSAADFPWWQQLEILPYPTPTLTLSSTQYPIAVLGDSGTDYIDFAAISNVGQVLDVTRGETTLVITTPFETFDVRMPLRKSGTSSFVQLFQTIDSNQIRFLDRFVPNVITISAIDTSLDVVISSSPYDWCPRTFDLSATTIQLTAFPAPIVDLFGAGGVFCVDQPITIVNTTTQTYSSVQYDADGLWVDFGNGTIAQYAPSSETIDVSYTSPGTYFVSVSGIRNGDVETTSIFGPIVVTYDCNITSSVYTSAITRDINKDIICPHDCGSFHIPNEWATHDVFNNLVVKIIENLDTVTNGCSAYNSTLPTGYLGWFGTHKSSPRVARWFSNQDTKLWFNDWYTANQQTPYTIGGLDQIKGVAWDVTDSFNTLYTIERNDIVAREFDASLTLLQTSQLTFRNIQLETPTLIAINSQRLVHIFDSNTQQLHIFASDLFDSEFLTLQYYFGGHGDQSTPSKFKGVQDIHITQTDNIVIVDSDNYCVKVFNDSLGWLATITSDQWYDTVCGPKIKPIAATSDQAQLYILGGKTVFVFDINTFEFIMTFDLDITQTPIKLYHNAMQPGFITVVCPDAIHKVTIDGLPIGQFASPDITSTFDGYRIDTQNNTNLFLGGAYNNRFQLLLATPYQFHLLVDVQGADSIRHNNDRHLWDAANLFVHKNDPVSDLTYNTKLARIWDNILLVRDSIHSRYIAQVNGGTGLTTSQTTRPILQSEVYPCNEHDNIGSLIGLNEPITAHVIHRVFAKMCEAIKGISQMANAIVGTEACGGQICWTWKALNGNLVPRARDCVSNPITFSELMSFVPKTFSSTWCAATGCGCAVTTVVTKAQNAVILWQTYGINYGSYFTVWTP